MANFSTSSSESEIDQILAEAMDHCVLEQVAAINCSSFSQSVLPSELETRFRKLKTFPSSNASKPLYKPQLGPDSDTASKTSGSGYLFGSNIEGKSGNSPSGQLKDSNLEGNLGGREGKMGNSPSGQLKVSNFEGDLGGRECKIGHSPSGQLKISNFEVNSGGGKGKKGISQGGYVSSPSDSSSGYMDSPKLKGRKHVGRGKIGNSLPGPDSFISDSEEEITRKSGVGCLCFSPKRVSRKKSGSGSGRTRGGELGFDWGKDEELLSDLRSFSSKEQKKRMKEAIKEEEKINKEAEKIVKWAKQVSARMDFDISDDDDDNHHTKHHSGRR